MTDSMYNALAPYIHIPQDSTIIHQQNSDTKKYAQKKDTILNLRTADTTELKMIRGIGSYRAKQIVKYREELGGYAHVEQIMEARGMDKAVADSILPHFFIDSVDVKKLNVNQCSIERLMRHPYIHFDQAKAIYEYRRRHIRIRTLEELHKIEGLDSVFLRKIAIYLDFSK
jgi:competence ComEA-like helix-hairpin-helix protein